MLSIRGISQKLYMYFKKLQEAKKKVMQNQDFDYIAYNIAILQGIETRFLKGGNSKADKLLIDSYLNN